MNKLLKEITEKKARAYDIWLSIDAQRQKINQAQNYLNKLAKEISELEAKLNANKPANKKG